MGVTSKEHPVEGPVTNAPKARDRVVRDPFYVSPERRKEYGIKDGEEVRWARDAEIWSKIEFSDRQEELMADPEDGGKGGRLVRTKEFDKVRIGGTAGDLVLMAFPKSVLEAEQAAVDEANSDYEQNMQRVEDGMESEEDLRPRKTRSQMLSEHEYHVKTGMIGGPTAGMSLLAAQSLMERKYGAAEIEAKQERLRMGGQHTETSDQAAFLSMLGAPRRLIAERAKSVAMGDSGFPRNPNSAVAQAAKRERRA